MTLKKAASFAALLWLCALSHSFGAQQPSNSVVLTGGRVISSPDSAPLDNATVVVESGRITAVGPSSRVRIPTAAKVIDCAGLLVVAGFQNSHVHFTEKKWTDA